MNKFSTGRRLLSTNCVATTSRLHPDRTSATLRPEPDPLQPPARAYRYLTP
ncbi:MAG: hypothetical protein IJ789_08250 [Bacteroidales bacterium]|nr:hypothetical protein [Bacteroidales bacterium]